MTTTMCPRPLLHGLLCAAALLFGLPALAQPFSVNWPLTSSMASGSSNPAMATGAPGLLSPGTPPVVVFDYWSGQGQRLNAGAPGWVAGPPNPTRFLQFDAIASPGQQLTVGNVGFDYGGAGTPNQMRSEVRWSIDNWATWTVVANTPHYAQSTMASFSSSVTVPPIPPGGRFSLRILPYATVSSTPMSPTFATHRHVKINGVATAVTPFVRLQITKSTGNTVVPGTYNFALNCTGPNGPYSGTASVVLPGTNPVITQVPQGSTCTVTETPVAGWSPPIWGGSNAPLSPSGWSAQLGPMNVNTTLIVTNQPSIPHVRLQITKSTGSNAVPGTYNFTLACTGPNGPFNGTASVTIPGGNPAIVQVPQGSSCNVTEAALAGWGQPIWGGSNVPLNPAGWSVQMGQMNVNSTLTVTNQPPAQTTSYNFEIKKSFMGPVVPGVYTFAIACGSGYTGPSSVSIAVPPAPNSAFITVPANATCTISENPVAGWTVPLWGGSTFAINPGNWQAQIGPINANGRVVVTNRP